MSACSIGAGGKNKEKDYIRLSVQGHYFVVKSSIIESNDWILSKIISSEIPWEKTSDDGQIYLDIDPTSFRIILAILNGAFDLSQDVSTLSRGDLALLKATARYLMLDRVYKQLETIETGIVKELREKDEEVDDVKKNMSEKNCKKDDEISDLKPKVEVLHRLQGQLNGLTIIVVQCRAYRTHRANNRCGEQSMILGKLMPEGHNDGPCGSCGNDCSRIYGENANQMPYITDQYDLHTIEGFVTSLENLEI